MTESIGGWLWGRNLRAFLEVLSLYTGYEFDGTDWRTIEAGVQDTDDNNPDLWYAYPLVGVNATLEVSLARAPLQSSAPHDARSDDNPRRAFQGRQGPDVLGSDFALHAGRSVQGAQQTILLVSRETLQDLDHLPQLLPDRHHLSPARSRSPLLVSATP
ncbi:hypothetical protein ACFW5P_25750 [Streptomyces rochei]|uniref:hypothetical protein n=1 Tax=Streptomyces rochei TaxID=1928 RepID=UPI0036C41DF1